jgi:hypothetical protein
MTFSNRILLKAAACVVAICAHSVSAQATAPLSEDQHIRDQLTAAAVGDVIRKTCPSISARMMTVYFKAKALESYARSAGYSDEEVRRFLKDKAEKARIKAMAAEYLAANGAVKGDVASYCALGQAEIKKNSIIGEMLREN